MKNLLFIGDLRTANNYGAVATTEALDRLLKNECYDINIKYIDFRSLYHPTPVDGLETGTTNKWLVAKKKAASYLSPSLKHKIKRFVNLFSKSDNSVEDFVPYKYAQYEGYYEKMQKALCLQYEKRMLEWADIVYINGEGNIVNGTDRYGKYRMGARYILFMAWVSKVKYNHPTLMVNHTVDPNNYNAFEMISHIYPLLDKVYVREPLSIALLNQYKIHNCTFVPDALWAYRPLTNWKPSEALKREIDFSKPYICLGDSSGIKNAYNQVKWDVFQVLSEIVDRLRGITPQIIFVDGYSGGNEDINELVKKKRLGRVNLNNCNYHDLYHVLEGASLFISGRWHASILCTLANTPILLWGSDSHKTKSLYTLLEYKYPFFEVATLPVNIDELIETAQVIINDSSAIQADMAMYSKRYAALAAENAKVLKDYV